MIIIRFLVLAAVLVCATLAEDLARWKIIRDCQDSLIQDKDKFTLTRQQMQVMHYALFDDANMDGELTKLCVDISKTIRDRVIAQHSISTDTKTRNRFSHWLKNTDCVTNIKVSEGRFTAKLVFNVLFEKLRAHPSEIEDIIKMVQTSEAFTKQYYAKYPKYGIKAGVAPCCFNFALRNEDWFVELVCAEKTYTQHQHGTWFLPYKGYELVKIDPSSPYATLMANDLMVSYDENGLIWHYGRVVGLYNGKLMVLSKWLSDGDIYLHEATVDLDGTHLAFFRKSCVNQHSIPYNHWMSKEAKALVNRYSGAQKPEVATVINELKPLAKNGDRYAIIMFRERLSTQLILAEKNGAKEADLLAIYKKNQKLFNEIFTQDNEATYFAFATLYTALNPVLALEYYKKALGAGEYKYSRSFFHYFKHFLQNKYKQAGLDIAECLFLHKQIHDVAVKHCLEFDSTKV